MAYPTSLDELTDGVPSDVDAPSTAMNDATYPHDDHHRALATAVEAIETELGTDPSGSEATVKARIAATEVVANAALTPAAAAAAYQPLDSDLTAIAALSTTAYGRALLALADAAAGRTALGLGTAATAATGDFDAAGAAAAAQAASQPVDSDLTAIAALTTTSYGRAFLALADAAAGRTALGLGGAATLSVGTTAGTVAAGDDSRITGALSSATAASTYQPLDSDLTAVAALTTPATTITGSAQKTLWTAKGTLVAASAASTPAAVAVGTNGHVLTADSTAATGVAWANIAAAPGRAKASGGTVYVGVPGGTYSGTSASVALATDTVYYSPIFVQRAITIDAVFSYCNGAGVASAARLGIYNADTDLQPTSLVSDFGTYDLSTTGQKSITSLSVTLSPGRYLSCLLSNNALASLYAFNVVLPGMTFANPADVSQTILRLSGSLSYAALPSTGQTWATATAGNAFPHHFFQYRWTPA